MLDLVTVKRALPGNLASLASQSLVDTLNAIAYDPDEAQAIRENFITYTGVLKYGKYKTLDYMNAVKFVSYKLMDMSDQDAYFKTFPDKHARWLAEGKDKRWISGHISMFKKGKLVQAIMEQSLVPTWVLNAHLHQKALNVQADLMQNATSELVRTQAANSLLTHLAKPKEVGPLINLDMRDSSGVKELKDTLAALAQGQLAAIQSGVPTRDIAAQNLVRAGEDITDV